MIGGRTRSREIALQVLFALDVSEERAQPGAPAPEGRRSAPIDALVDTTTLDDAEASDEVRAFARALVSGVLADRPRIDALVSAAAENWELSRIAAVDRNVLRLAVHELLSRDEIPAKVSINEAIELSKRFGGAQSGAFVNGVLDRIRRDLGIALEEPAS